MEFGCVCIVFIAGFSVCMSLCSWAISKLCDYWSMESEKKDWWLLLLFMHRFGVIILGFFCVDFCAIIGVIYTENWGLVLGLRWLELAFCRVHIFGPEYPSPKEHFWTVLGGKKDKWTWTKRTKTRL